MALQILNYTAAVDDPEALVAEIIAAVPSLAADLGQELDRQIQIRVNANGGEIDVVVPDSLSQLQIDDIDAAVAAHTPTAIPPFRFRTVASANVIAIPDLAEVCLITGTTTIKTITLKDAGYRVCLLFDGSITITNNGPPNGNLYLAGAFAAAGGDVIDLICGGDYWYEVSRSENTIVL